MIFKILFFVLGLYSLASVTIFGLKYEWFTINLALFRKVLYLQFFIILGIGIIFNLFNWSNWKVLIELVSVVIILDLSIFQTPHIIKFGNAEFQHSQETLIKTILKNDKNIEKIENKSEVFCIIVQKAKDYFNTLGNNRPSNFNEYKLEIQDFLSQYTKEYNFELNINSYDTNTGDENITKENIRTVVKEVFQLEGIALNNRRIGNIVNNLFEPIASQISKELIFIPIETTNYSTIISIRSSGEEILRIDGYILISLVNIYDWHREQLVV
jgi:hypothetical protein